MDDQPVQGSDCAGKDGVVAGPEEPADSQPLG